MSKPDHRPPSIARHLARPRQLVRPLLLGGAILLGGSASAQAGFFESLFGLNPAPAAAPASAFSHGNDGDHRTRFANHRRHDADRRSRPRTVVAKTPEVPKLQRTTGLLDDPTLRTGDAVMTKSGIRVFDGDRASHHGVEEFVPLRGAMHVKKEARPVLALIDDVAHRDIGRERGASAVSTGRSAYDGARPTRPSYGDPKIMVRYVGP